MRTTALTLLSLLLAAALTGCGGEKASGSRLVDADEFATAIADPARVTINVHVPDEGSIAGTALAIGFDAIDARAAELPATGTPLALYCLSGRMSAEAAVTLRNLGFTDVVELRGGMRAWAATGRPLLSSTRTG